MKKITEKNLVNNGFKENKKKSNAKAKIYSKDRFEVAIKPDGSAFYTNIGFNYSVQSMEALLSLFYSMRKKKL